MTNGEIEYDITLVQVEQLLSQLPICVYHILNPLCFDCEGSPIKIGESKSIFRSYAKRE